MLLGPSNTLLIRHLSEPRWPCDHVAPQREDPVEVQIVLTPQVVEERAVDLDEKQLRQRAHAMHGQQPIDHRQEQHGVVQPQIAVILDSDAIDLRWHRACLNTESGARRHAVPRTCGIPPCIWYVVLNCAPPPDRQVRASVEVREHRGEVERAPEHSVGVANPHRAATTVAICVRRASKFFDRLYAPPQANIPRHASWCGLVEHR
mmetsp:Transcript_9032/g.18364  ORF Transcript_9032/g.18364 Transcript_9032/m.18364 type:complete len:205 (+) Transcript_9032:604-1218(+)